MIIDVFQDTICPWCRIGDKHLKQAIAQWDGDVTVRHHPFELRPDMPAEGTDFAEYMAKLKGDRNIKPMLDHVCRAGENCDLTFQFDQIERMPNTLLSHVLIQAAPEDRQTELLDAIHDAYFEHGQDIGKRAVLLEIATAIGLDRGDMEAALDNSELRESVAERANWARQQGITGVPFFVFDNAVVLSGAQPVTTMLAAMNKGALKPSAV